MTLTNQTILIVGASSGIGKTLAIRLASYKNRIIIVARREKQLNEVENAIVALGSECMTIVADALDTNESAAVVEKCLTRFKSIDLAILNVGAGPQMDLKTIEAKTVIDNMNLNYVSMVNFLFPVLKQMQVNNNGMIVHINSIAGLRAIPKQGPYSAAKGAARLLIEACQMEYKDSNIKFISIYPGYVRTERVMKYEHKKPFSLSEEKAVDHILKAITREKEHYAFPSIMKWAIRLLNMLPRRISNQILLNRN